MCARIVDKEKKRLQILEAAQDVFIRQGIYNFKMIDIAEKAGVGKGTLYEYFKHKEDLVNGVFNSFLKNMSAEIEQKVDLEVTPENKIRAYLATTLGYFEKYPEDLQLVFDLWSKVVKAVGKATSTLQVLSEDYRDMIKQIATVIQEGQRQNIFKEYDSMMIASALVAYVEGIMFQIVIGVYKLDSQKTADEVSRIFFEGIRK